MRTRTVEFERSPGCDSPTYASPLGMAGSHFEHRAALAVDSVEDAARGRLPKLAENRYGPVSYVASTRTTRPAAVGVTGRAPVSGMARELSNAEPVCAETSETSRTRSMTPAASILESGFATIAKPWRGRRNVGTQVVLRAGRF